MKISIEMCSDVALATVNSGIWPFSKTTKYMHVRGNFQPYWLEVDSGKIIRRGELYDKLTEALCQTLSVR